MTRDETQNGEQMEELSEKIFVIMNVDNGDYLFDEAVTRFAIGREDYKGSAFCDSIHTARLFHDASSATNILESARRNGSVVEDLKVCEIRLTLNIL